MSHMMHILIYWCIYIYIFAHKHITLQCCLHVAFFARFRLESPSHVRRFLSLIAVPGQTRHYMWLHVPSCAPCLSALKANQEKGIGIIIKLFFGANLSKLFAWHLSITGHMEPRMQRMQRRMQRSKDNHPTMAPVLPEDQWKEDLKISWFQTQILPHTAADRFGRYLT